MATISPPAAGDAVLICPKDVTRTRDPPGGVPTARCLVTTAGQHGNTEGDPPAPRPRNPKRPPHSRKPAIHLRCRHPVALVLADLLTLPGRSDAEAAQLMDTLGRTDKAWEA